MARLLLYGGPLVASLGLFAEGANNPTVGFPWENLTALAILAFVAVIFVSKTLPNMIASHNKTIETVTTEFSGTVKEIHKTVHEDSERLNDTLRNLTANCAAVRAQQKE